MVLRIWARCIFQSSERTRSQFAAPQQQEQSGITFFFFFLTDARYSKSKEALRLKQRLKAKRAGGGRKKMKQEKQFLLRLPRFILSSPLKHGETCLRLSAALAFGMSIHRQRLTVGHLAPLQSLHERRTEMRALAALSRGSVRRVHIGTPPPSLAPSLLTHTHTHTHKNSTPPFSHFLPTTNGNRDDVSTRSFQIQQKCASTDVSKNDL